jgi:hypothetical protein
MEDRFGNYFEVRTGLVIVQEEEVDIRIRIQFSSAVSATRYYREMLMEPGKSLGVSVVSVTKDGLQQAVHDGREIVNDFESASTAEVTLKQISANPSDILPSNIASTSTIL